MTDVKWFLAVLMPAAACYHVEPIENVATDTGTDTDTVLPTDCKGLNDFTLCSVVTTPDRSYDICINGFCRSPGCGTAVCNAPGPHFSIPDTNQRACYDDGTVGEIPCPTSGQAYYGQDAEYGWDVTHAAIDRFTRNTSVANHPVVTDNVTTLMWQGCAAGLSGDTCAIGTVSSSTWGDALVYCESLLWSGYTDWRLPDPYELESITDAGRNNPAIDVTAFPSTPSSWFLSSSSDAAYEGDAWIVGFNYGYVDKDGKSNYGHVVRCVRGGLTGAVTRFTRSTATVNEPVVTDTVTGLVWQGCAAGQMGDDCSTDDPNLAGTGEKSLGWVDALAHCESLTWGGFSDWRLPNKKELHGITDKNLYNPVVDVTAFPATSSNWFWSSSSYVGSEDLAWGEFFYHGNVNNFGKNDSGRVRCVRNG